MKFYNPNPYLSFRKRNNLYITGYCNYTDVQLEKKLASGEIPQDIRGTFAYVYINPKLYGHKWIACVDHFSSISLYYTKDTICPDFHELAKKTDKTRNEFIAAQLDIMRDRTVGPQTIYKEIRRVEAEHYCVNGVQRRYSDILCEHEIKPIDHEENYERLKYITQKMVKEDPVICFSAGKDSAFVAMVAKSLGYDPRMVFIDSPRRRNTVDSDACQEYRDLGWNIETFNVSGTREFPEDMDKFEYEFWCNGQFSVKRRAMAQYPGIKMSGEIGGGLPKSNVISCYLINQGHIDIDSAVNIWLNSLYTYRKRHYPKPSCNEQWGDLRKTEAFEYIFEHYRDIFRRSPHDYLHTVYSFPIVDGAEHRIWAEGQDDMNRWFNMFADYDIQASWINSPFEDRNRNGIQKFQMYEICRKFYSGFTDISWNYPIVGISILK